MISMAEKIRATIQWYKDGREIVDDGGEHYAISRNETYSLLNITKVCECDTSFSCYTDVFCIRD